MGFKLTPPFPGQGASKPHSYPNGKEVEVEGVAFTVLKVELEPGIAGEANNDGSIFLSHKLEPGSEQEQHVLMHEMVHQTDMKLGKLGYNDNYVKWNGQTYPRKDGHILYNNEWVREGSKEFPWEKMPWE